PEKFVNILLSRKTGLFLVAGWTRGFDSLPPLACLAGNVDAGTEPHRSRSAADEKVLSATGNEEPLSRLQAVKFRERGFLRDLKIGQRPDKCISRRSRRPGKWFFLAWRMPRRHG